jgi:hypothetical protein
MLLLFLLKDGRYAGLVALLLLLMCLPHHFGDSRCYCRPTSCRFDQ